MPSVVFTSASLSPGATTLAALTGSRSGPDAVVIEADEAAAVLAPRLGLSEQPSALDLASTLGAGLDRQTLFAHCQTVGGSETDWRALVAPPEPAQVRATYRALAEPLAALLATETVLGLVDVGRVTPASVTWPLVAGADLVVLMSRCRLEEFRPFAARARELAEAGARVAAVLVADGPYRPTEFAAVAGVELVGLVPADARGAAALWGAAVSARRAARSPLWGAGRELAAALAARLRPAAPITPAPKEVATP